MTAGGSWHKISTGMMVALNRALAAAVSAVVLASGVAFGQSRLTLRDAVSLAQRSDPDVAEADARERSAVREAELARARFGPTLFTGTGYLYTYGFPLTPGGAPPSVFNLAFNQTLWDGPARGRARAADERAQLQRLEARKVRGAVAVEAAETYLELVAMRQSLERQRSAAISAEAIVTLSIARLNEGRILPVDVLEVRRSAAQVAERIAQLLAQETILESQLRVLTGLPPGEPIEVTFEDLPSLPDRSDVELLALADANSPELKAAELERRAREATLAGEEDGRWPTVDLVGNYAVFSRFNNIDTFYNRFQTNSLNVGVEARVPLFNAQTGAQIALARSDLAVAGTSMKRQQEAVELDVRRAAGDAHERAASHDVAELDLAIAQEHVRLTDARLAEGRADRLDVEKTLVEEGRAWDAFYQAEFSREKAQLELRRVTGEMSGLFP